MALMKKQRGKGWSWLSKSDSCTTYLLLFVADFLF